MAEQQDEQQSAGYPLGRGYGHDYMRGGEVFGGYGYSQRGAYETPRGDHPDPNETAPDSPTNDALAAALSALPAPDESDPDRHLAIDHSLDQLEHTFGSSGGNLRHSRSYYVTQAQLQQRLHKNGGDHGSPPGQDIH
ncbi:MAG: hypothetical protein M3081_23005 [Gemmatimonadota bacterium]|nr:hypothetical protein [Gemmatimonadota bacterium]